MTTVKNIAKILKYIFIFLCSFLLDRIFGMEAFKRNKYNLYGAQA